MYTMAIILPRHQDADETVVGDCLDIAQNHCQYTNNSFIHNSYSISFKPNYEETKFQIYLIMLLILS